MTSTTAIEQFARAAMRLAISDTELTDYAMSAYAQYVLLTNDYVAEEERKYAVEYLRKQVPYKLEEVNYIMRQRHLAEYR